MTTDIAAAAAAAAAAVVVVVVVVVVIIIIILIIALKARIRDFFLQSPHVRSSGPSAGVCKSRATHGALITCNMSCYVPRGTKGQLSY